MASHAIEVKAALKTLVDGLPALSGYVKTWGATRSPDKRWVFLGKIDWSSSEWVTNRSREEDFTIEVVVNVQMARATGEAAETEAVAIMRAIEQAVTNNPNLGMAEVVSTDFVPRSVASWPVDNGVIEAQVEAGIRVTARFSREA